MSGALLDIKGLTEPAKVLIERISDAVGGLARPWQIERVARAEGRAELIKAEARIQITELEQRAIRRLVVEEGKKQENIENIAEEAARKVREDARPEAIETDWLTAFFERCRNISDREMQSIWAGLLAEEANYPGRYQRKTIDLLATLSRADAELFSKMKIFTARVINRDTPLIYDHNNELVTRHGLTFEVLNQLQDLGLINFNFAATYYLTFTGTDVPVRYGSSVTLLHVDEGGKFNTGRVLFTKAGLDLIGLCGDSSDPAVLEMWKDTWESHGFLQEKENAQATAEESHSL